jgi:hypothetical protein
MAPRVRINAAPPATRTDSTGTPQPSGGADLALPDLKMLYRKFRAATYQSKTRIPTGKTPP